MAEPRRVCFIVLALQKPDPRAFPIGVAMAWFTAHEKIKSEYQLAITVGLLGGFTTFSRFAYEAFRLAEAHELGKAALYVLFSNALGLTAASGCYVITMRASGK